MGGVTHRHILQQRLLFHRQGRELRLHPGQRFRHGVKTHANTRRGGVQQVHRLVRQLTAGEVTPGEGNGGFNGFIRNVHPVVLCVAGLQAPEHQAGGVVVRLVNLNHLEAALQCSVALEVLLVLAPGGGGDGAQFTAGQRRLQQVGCIRAARLIACADNGMGLVNEKENRQWRLLHRVYDVFQSLFEFPLHTCPRLQQAKVKGAHAHRLQAVRHIAFRNAQRQPLHQRGLADTRLAHQNRVVLAAS